MPCSTVSYNGKPYETQGTVGICACVQTSNSPPLADHEI